MKYVRQLLFCAFCISTVLAAFVLKPSEPASKLDGASVVKLPVLMYHQVLDNQKKLGKYVISPAELERDMKEIRDRGFETVTVRELVDYYNGKGTLPSKPIMLTFDDGYETDYVYVFPLLKKYNMRAVFSIVGAYAEEYSRDVHKHINYSHLSWSEIDEMNKSGLAEFQNHSYNMHSFDERKGCLKISNESEWHYNKMLKEDLELSQRLFEEKTGITPICFTYPFGSTDERLLSLVRDFGFAATLGTYERVNILTGKREELYDIRRFNRPHNYDIRRVLRQAE